VARRWGRGLGAATCAFSVLAKISITLALRPQGSLLVDGLRGGVAPALVFVVPVERLDAPLFPKAGQLLVGDDPALALTAVATRATVKF